MSEHHDDWFQHDASEPTAMESHGDINSVAIIGFLILTFVSVIAVGFVTYKWYASLSQSLHVEVREDRADEYYSVEKNSAFAAWEGALEQPRWVNRDEGVVTVPVDRAARLVAAEYLGENAR
ncbi:MAG: hypothetical protein AAGD00_07100 [Planctomycetota bacterium]